MTYGQVNNDSIYDDVIKGEQMMTFHFWINYTVKCSKALKTLLHTLSEKKRV